MKKLWAILSWLPLLLAFGLTINAQAHWDNPTFWWLFSPQFWLWAGNVVVWVIWMLHPPRAQKRPAWMIAVPACLAILLVGYATNAPLRVVFWLNKGALESALSYPTSSSRSLVSAPRIGWFTPLQITKSHGATRFILWENPGFLDGTAIGFAHGPKRDGCSSASFENFYERYQLAPTTLQMNEEWVAVSAYGTNM